MVGTNPGTEGTSSQQHPDDEHSEGTDQQIDDDVLVSQHHLQCRVEVNHVKADKAGGGQ